MVKKNFDLLLKTLKPSIASYDYYVDFASVYVNVEEVKIPLNILNSLLGSKNINDEFKNLLIKYPEILKAIPILLAKREYEIIAMDDKGYKVYDFLNINYSPDEYCYFMEETGLFDLIQNHVINNLYDYCLGVETGLNSNARKNRTGKLMENLVEDYINKAGYILDKNFFSQACLDKIINLCNVNFSKIDNALLHQKKFDFLVLAEKNVYAIECNFYSSQGSKLNETARSYKNIALDLKDVQGIKFMWITDGIGWKSAKNNLKETYDALDDLYNIDDLENGLFNNLK